jgi:hypothetical protein
MAGTEENHGHHGEEGARPSSLEGLQRLGIPRSTIYWNVEKLRTAYGVHPDKFELRGVSIDPAAYWAAGHNPRIARKQ